MLCAKLGWNWHSGSGEEDFKILSAYFRYFIIISPWKRAGPFISTSVIPITQGCFVPSVNEIGQVVLDKKSFWNFVNVYLPFCNYLPLEKGGALLLKELESLLPENALCQFSCNWSRCSGEDGNVKSLWQQRQRQRRTTDKLWSWKYTWAFGSAELKT